MFPVFRDWRGSSYLLLVDHTGRLFRAGKAVLSREVAEILDRLGSAPSTGRRGWRDCGKALLGRFLAATASGSAKSPRVWG